MNNSIGIYPVYQALVFVVTDTGLCHDRHWSLSRQTLVFVTTDTGLCHDRHQCLRFSLQSAHYQYPSFWSSGLMRGLFRISLVGIGKIS